MSIDMLIVNQVNSSSLNRTFIKEIILHMFNYQNTSTKLGRCIRGFIWNRFIPGYKQVGGCVQNLPSFPSPVK